MAIRVGACQEIQWPPMEYGEMAIADRNAAHSSTVRSAQTRWELYIDWAMVTPRHTPKVATESTRPEPTVTTRIGTRTGSSGNGRPRMYVVAIAPIRSISPAADTNFHSDARAGLPRLPSWASRLIIPMDIAASRALPSADVGIWGHGAIMSDYRRRDPPVEAFCPAHRASTSPHFTAIGLTGDPTAPVMGRGAAVSQNS